MTADKARKEIERGILTAKDGEKTKVFVEKLADFQQKTGYPVAAINKKISERRITRRPTAAELAEARKSEHILL
jgi:hypothetical protein